MGFARTTLLNCKTNLDSVSLGWGWDAVFLKSPWCCWLPECISWGPMVRTRQSILGLYPHSRWDAFLHGRGGEQRLSASRADKGRAQVMALLSTEGRYLMAQLGESWAGRWWSWQLFARSGLVGKDLRFFHSNSFWSFHTRFIFVLWTLFWIFFLFLKENWKKIGVRIPYTHKNVYLVYLIGKERA